MLARKSDREIAKLALKLAATAVMFAGFCVTHALSVLV